MAITVEKSRIVVNLDAFVKQYFINPSFEYLLATLHLLRPQIADKILEITATVQTPLNLYPFQGIIDAIADIVNLTPDRIIVKTRNRDFHHPRATTIILADDDFFSFPRSILLECKNLKFKLDDDPVLFGALYGRPSYPRLILGHYLETVYPNHSYVTLLSELRHIRDNIDPVRDFFKDQLIWAEQRHNPINAPEAECHRGSLTFPENIRLWPRIWGKYRIEIIVETDYHNRTDWTEKTWKCIGSGKPFISMTGAGALQHMRNLGLQTFHPWIDESYDLEKNVWKRLELIKKEIDRLVNLGRSHLHDTILAIQEIADNNIKISMETYGKNIHVSE